MSSATTTLASFFRCHHQHHKKISDIWTEGRAATDEHKTDTDRQRPGAGLRLLRRATLLSQGGTKPALLPHVGRLKANHLPSKPALATKDDKCNPRLELLTDTINSGTQAKIFPPGEPLDPRWKNRKCNEVLWPVVLRHLGVRVGQQHRNNSSKPVVTDGS